MGTTEILIAYIIQNLSGKITKTQLVKLMYLADLESTKFSGNQISDIKWKKHFYGPYDERLDDRLGSLEKEGVITIEQKTKKDNPDAIYFLYQYKSNDKIHLKLDAVKKQIVDTIIKQFGSFTLNSLLEYVYGTKPLEHTKRGQYIDLKRVISAQKE